MRVRQHPQACAGARPTYTTAIGRTAWDIIRHSGLSCKGRFCRCILVPVLHKSFRFLRCVGVSPARRFCFSPGARGRKPLGCCGENKIPASRMAGRQRREYIMNAEQLKEYLGIVVDMEKECFLQEQLRRQLEWQISSLGNPGYIAPVKPPTDGADGSIVTGSFIIFFVVCLPVGFIINLFTEFSILATAAILATIATLLICLLVSASTNQEHHQYEADLQTYQQAIDEDKRRVQEELNISAYLKQELEALNRQSAQSQKTLLELYSKNIIFPKYRSFVMVATIYEYFCSERCSSLEGHEGAYNILEMELRLNRIISQLDQVISQLEAIKNNQYIIYSAIQESNQKLTEILESNRQIESSVRRLEVQGDELNARLAGLQATSTLSLYFNELNHKELAYRNRMGL